MKPLTWTQDYQVTSFLVNLRGEAGLHAMLSFIQDVGWQHALQLDVKLPKNFTWVFTRQKLVMRSWPKWKETVTIKTWLRSNLTGPFLLRDYEIYRKDDLLGVATATFTAIDLTTRKIGELDWNAFHQILPSHQQSLPITPEKIVFQTGKTQDLVTFQVRNSDLDLNFHVNNTKYAQWILDAIPIDTLTKGPHLHSYEVNFLAEAKLGNEIQLQLIEHEGLPAAPPPSALDGGDSSRIRFFQFQGQRKPDGKPIFTALLGAMEE